MTSPAITAKPGSLAELLLSRVRTAGLLNIENLSANPITALEDDPTVRIVWIEPSALPSGCSVAAACDKSCNPARILVSLDASLGRRCFSALHEYAHLLRDQVPEVLEALFTASNAGAELEERVCDEFAARVMLPDALLDSALGPNITARAVLSLIASAHASAEACAVAAARRLPAPGYVMLLSRDGTARFTAYSGDVYYVRRGTAQVGLLAEAATGRPVRGRQQVRYSTGNLSREMFADASTQNNRTVAILVTDSPPWGGLTIGAKQGPEGTSGYCDHCAREFTSFARTCQTCEQAPCPECGQCACNMLEGLAGERTCNGCYLVLPPAAYPTVKSSICTECS